MIEGATGALKVRPLVANSSQISKRREAFSLMEPEDEEETGNPGSKGSDET
jgi:hypothetical protein